MKSLANAHRLRILCSIVEGEKPVGEMAASLSLSSSVVSQHLALMRRENLIEARRDGQTIYYRLADARVARTLELLSDIFCRAS